MSETKQEKLYDQLKSTLKAQTETRLSNFLSNLVGTQLIPDKIKNTIDLICLEELHKKQIEKYYINTDYQTTGFRTFEFKTNIDYTPKGEFLTQQINMSITVIC
jgi:hypothetical protein